MLIGGDDISDDVSYPWRVLSRVFQCLLTFALVFEEKQLQALLPFPAPPPERPGQLARRLVP